MLMLIVSIAQAQHCSDNINTVTTDWRSPLSLNTWDWTTPYWEVKYRNAIGQTIYLTDLLSPFYDTQNLNTTLHKPLQNEK